MLRRGKRREHGSRTPRAAKGQGGQGTDTLSGESPAEVRNYEIIFDRVAGRRVESNVQDVVFRGMPEICCVRHLLTAEKMYEPFHNNSVGVDDHAADLSEPS